MLSERNKDILFCILAFATALLVLVASFSYQPSSAYFPQLLAVFIAVLAAALGIQRLKAAASRANTGDDRPELLGFVKVVTSILAYTGAMLLVGFSAGTFVFLTLMMLLLGNGGWC